MTSDYRARRDRVRVALAQAGGETGADAVVISDLINVRYLTGFTGSNGAVLIWCDDASADRICTDGRYLTQVAEQAGDLDAVIARDCLTELAVHAAGKGARTVGFESDAVTVAAHRGLADRMGELDSAAAELVPLQGLVQGLRLVKDAGEVDALRRACAVGDSALATIVERGVIRPGATERAVARDLEWEMFALGADAVAFETIVAAGANSAVPHHRPTDAVLADGDLVKIDFGAVVAGYHSDMTRTYVLGRAADWQREIYDLVAAAQAAGRAALHPDAELRGVDAAARSVIADAGHGEHYVHGLGHGVGLEIHEAPGIGALATGTLPCGAAVTVEPGVYLPGRGGVRIEDTLVVTDGPPELLTATDKTFTVI